VAGELLRQGDVRRAVVLGADVITARVLKGFDLLRLLAKGPCVPFSSRLGTSLGEGAAAVVLDADRSAPGDAVALLGWGTANDAFHATKPHPRGRGTRQALMQAMRSVADSTPVATVHAHATGTAANDVGEWAGIMDVLGDPSIPVAASKGVVGHTQGAAGVVETVLTLAAARRGRHAPTVAVRPDERRAGGPQRHGVAADGARPLGLGVLVKVNSGFGGANGAVVFGPPGVARPPRADVRQPVYLIGGSAVDGQGRTRWNALDAGRARVLGRRVEIDPRRAVRGIDLRGLDRSSTSLVVAVSDALADAQIRRGRRGIGLIVGQARASPEQLARILAGTGNPASTFARGFLGFPASLAAIELGLDGPFAVLADGTAAGMSALGFAVATAAGEGSSPLIVGQVAESDGDGAESYDGASAVVLANSGTIRVAGFASLPGRRRDDAACVALERAGLAGDRSPLRVDAPDDFPGCDLYAVLRAAAAIRCGKTDAACVTATDAHAGTTAVVLVSSAVALG
jgi:3-oxoacyl-[acyl-carrier-protein] synthase II